MDVQYISDGHGGKLAIVNAQAFDEMYQSHQQRLEDIYDAMCIEQSYQNFIDGGSKYIPVEHFERVIDGENPVRVYREWRGLTMAQLAEKVGITVGYLSSIERSIKIGTVATYQKIAEVLDLPLDDIVPVEQIQEN